MSQTISTFDSTKEPLQDILRAIHEGKIQLPDFQRGWVWDDAHILSLIASIANAFPIGAVMGLETGSAEVKFKSRLIEGVNLKQQINPDRLILDGQQRLTSLYQALYSTTPALTRDTKGNEIKRLYFIDIQGCLQKDADLEECIISAPESKQIVNFRGEVQQDFSSQELEWKHEYFPLNIVFDVSKWNSWQAGYLQADGPGNVVIRLQRWNAFYARVLQSIQQYNVPVIKLAKETPKAAICQVFEKVNTGGVSLTVFELLTATFAMDDFNLRDDWFAREKKLKEQKVLAHIPSDNFLQGIALLASYERRMTEEKKGTKPDDLPAVSCKRKDILKLELSDYLKWADKLHAGFVNASRFLHTQFIFSANDLPYQSQLVPLAAILVLLDAKFDNDGIRAKVKRWFWCGILSEQYGSATETKFARDVYEFIAWINSGSEPTTIGEANFYPARLLSLRSRGSAAYKGIYSLLIQKGSFDFRTGEPINSTTYFDEWVDIHHIFPKKWCDENEWEPSTYNSIVNKTPLSYKTNRKIGGHAPSVYLSRIIEETENSQERQEEILRTHVVEAEYLKQDDFVKFFNTRARAILTIISEAMGKKVEIEEGKEILDL